jgi:hypothetical protein
MILLAGRHIYGKSHVDLIVETFPDLPENNGNFHFQAKKFTMNIVDDTYPLQKYP